MKLPAEIKKTIAAKLNENKICSSNNSQYFYWNKNIVAMLYGPDLAEPLPNESMFSHWSFESTTVKNVDRWEMAITWHINKLQSTSLSAKTWEYKNFQTEKQALTYLIIQIFLREL